VDDEGFRLDLQTTDLDPAVLDELKLTSDQIDTIVEQLPEHIQDVKHLMG
jgi:hypothetical protein